MSEQRTGLNGGSEHGQVYVHDCQETRYREALERIRREAGKVCEEYGVCEHHACQSSYNAWAVADAYLTGHEAELFEGSTG